MAKQHSIQFLIRDQAEPLVFPVREEVPDRVSRILNAENLADELRFFWFETLGGESVVLNLADVQAVRYLADPDEDASSALPDDAEPGNGPVRIKLRRRPVPLYERARRPEEIFDLFTDLEHGPDAVAYPGFIDGDGELIQLNPYEVVWVTAPTRLLQEGERIAAEDAGEETPVQGQG